MKRGQFQEIGVDRFEVQHTGWYGFLGFMWTMATLNHMLRKHDGNVKMEVIFPMPWF